MPDPRAEELESVLDDVAELLDCLTAAEKAWQTWTDQVTPEHRASALNLVHYWAIRQLDLRDLQYRLASLGLSSLGRSEAQVQATLRAVAAALAAMLGQQPDASPAPEVGFDDGRRLIGRNAEALLGEEPSGRATRIMVTLPTAAATDTALVAELIEHGMQIARINCAHDDPQTWRKMAAQVRNCAQRAGVNCRIAMDLSGPKLRTGPLVPGPQVVRIRPVRDALGRAVVPARAWLTSTGAPMPAPDPDLVCIPVAGGWLRQLAPGDVLEVRDTRDSRRWLEVERIDHGGAVVSCEQTAYLGTGTRLHVVGTGADTAIGDLPAVEQFLRLQAGDVLRLTRDLAPVAVDAEAPSIGCSPAELFGNVQVGARVLFDDGKLGARVIAQQGATLDLQIEQPTRGTVKLRADKGINVPDTDLPIPALTDKDIADLAVVAELADLVQVSFVRRPDDIERLFAELDRLGADHLGVVLKIETRSAFERLPQLLLTALRRNRVGVMIARGDLAVECGYERMAEVQEEILWLCEAGHLPVIWATQVFEQLARSGRPSRAEVSDAALAERAECVMLNKGPYIVDAVDALQDVLDRMSGHHYKKVSLLRPLRSWRPTASDMDAVDAQQPGAAGSTGPDIVQPVGTAPLITEAPHRADAVVGAEFGA